MYIYCHKYQEKQPILTFKTFERQIFYFIAGKMNETFDWWPKYWFIIDSFSFDQPIDKSPICCSSSEEIFGEYSP